MSKKIISMLFIGLMLSLALSYTVQAGDTGKQTGLLYFDDDGAFQNGYNLFTKLSATTVYLTDTMGRVVNTWTDTATTGLSLYLRTDGDLLRTTKSDDSTVGVSGRFSAGGVGGRVKRISWGGSVEWNYIYSTSLHRSHHDIEELPNGNILMVAWEYKNQTECLNAGRYSNQMTAGELWPDTIVEVNPSTSQIVWEWHFWDHLSCDRAGSWTANGRAVSSDTTDSGLVDINYCPDTTADWTHTNAVDYNADLNQIVISCRSLDEIYIIDHDTTTQEAIGSAGKFLYRWGNPLAYQTGSSTNHKLF
ncbi:MAG TPA: aryl-sulfate sulfotransferase, partial [Desulfatiglandales bacterium]|nr:aryl-sulfate sulfotransferase [Desulfatiglandales bacterium]